MQADTLACHGVESVQLQGNCLSLEPWTLGRWRFQQHTRSQCNTPSTMWRTRPRPSSASSAVRGQRLMALTTSSCALCPRNATTRPPAWHVLCMTTSLMCLRSGRSAHRGQLPARVQLLSASVRPDRQRQDAHHAWGHPKGRGDAGGSAHPAQQLCPIVWLCWIPCLQEVNGASIAREFA